MKSTYTEFEVETAMCLWEAYLDRLRSDAGDPIRAKIVSYIESEGYASTRMHVLDLCKECDTEWAKLSDDDKGSMTFDWDFCPAFIHRKVLEGYFD